MNLNDLTQNICDRLTAAEIEHIPQKGAESATITGTYEGNGFTIRITPGSGGHLASVTVTPYQSGVHCYPADQFEEGMKRVLSLFNKNTAARLAAVNAYLANQTEEGWQRFLTTVSCSLGGMVVTLHEKDSSVPPEEARKIKVRVSGDSDFLYINPEGYGEPGAGKGHGSPVFLELYDSELRVIVSPDILDTMDDKQIISLENAREDRVTDWS